ncbi:response regulator [Haloferax namakaokahaiae]|uniref:Response regulator n=1 Tax=Haloferax namakaokahaiae TaxID=1748331 RepID=A0ABD5Z9K6_9EURY
MTGDVSTTVLAVDDESSLTALYERWLADEYEVHTTTAADEALELVTAHDPDVVMLDRQMPSMSGDDVLEQVREHGYDCPVVMVTGLDPGLEIVEMPFDDYLVKPVERSDLHDTLDALLARRAYDERVRTYFSLARKKAVLEATTDPDVLESSDEFRSLKAEFASARAEADDARSEVSGRDAWLSIQD